MVFLCFIAEDNVNERNTEIKKENNVRRKNKMSLENNVKMKEFKQM